MKNHLQASMQRRWHWPLIAAQRRPWLAVTAGLMLSGCASLSPQIFSDDMLPSNGKPAETGTLAEAKASAQQAMSRYNAAVQELSGVTPQVGVGLIALSALALLKNISHPNGSDIAGVGVVGSAAYLYGNTVVSKPRQLTYIAGSRALACSIAAIAPYDVPAIQVEKWTKAQDQMNAKRTALKNLLATHADLLKSKTVTSPAIKPQLGVCDKSPRPICTPPSGSTPEEGQRFTANCNKYVASQSQQCAIVPAKSSTLVVHPLLGAAAAQAEGELAAATVLDDEVATLRAKLSTAASELRWQSRQIQLRVSEEVLKTEPDLASILSATGGMRSTAFALTGATAFKPSSGELQAAGGTPRALDAQTQAAIDDIKDATTQLREARKALADLLRPTADAIRGLRTTLQQCQFTAPAITLKIHPDVDELSVQKGGTQTFYVSGGTGNLSGRVVSLAGRPAGSVRSELDVNGRTSFIYTAPAAGTGVEGDSLLFADATEQARRTIIIKTADAGTMTDAVLPEMTAEEAQWLGLPANATAAQKQTAVLKCQKAVGKPTPATGTYDAETRSEVRKKTICLSIFTKQ